MGRERGPRHEPTAGEDARNLTIVGASAGVAALLTIGLVAAAPSQSYEIRNVDHVRVDDTHVVVSYRTDADRLYGTVVTTDGTRVTGFIRWDRNEGSLSDVLDASKPRPRGSSSASGIRFGHVQRIRVTSRDGAEVTLRSGERVALEGRATDLGTGLRALVVEIPDGRVAELGWRDLDHVDFMEAPAAAAPSSRLFGTLTTRSGQAFTGYVTWDVDEIYTTDILDGDDESGARRRIPFGAIATIERASRRAARVALHDGSVLLLDGTNDVDASIGGIAVSDPNLGQVEVDWDGFSQVRFHEPVEGAASVSFDGGAPLHGTVVTRSGEELTGEIVWDADEAFTWEMLNGEADGVTFDIEFGRIASIERVRDGARVTLRDGRSFTLRGSNDVDDGNRGIIVSTGTGAHDIDWEDFAELRLEP